MSSKLQLDVCDYNRGAPNAESIEKRDFRSISRFIPETIQDRAIVTVERQYELKELLYDLSNGAISNDLE